MYDNVVHDLIQLVKEVIVDTLIIEEDRPDHIAEHNNEHSVILTLSAVVLDDAQTPEQRCRYTWHNARPTSGCS
jgi:hypothetical protein